MAIFTILYGNYYSPHGEFELICIGKFSRRTWVNFTQQYGKNRQRWQQNTFTMLYGNYCYIFIENFPQKFSQCRPTNLIAAVHWAVWEILRVLMLRGPSCEFIKLLFIQYREKGLVQLPSCDHWELVWINRRIVGLTKLWSTQWNWCSCFDHVLHSSWLQLLFTIN